MTIKTILVDDEALARQIMLNYARAYPDLEIVDQCSNGFEALKSIQLNQPDLIFLDIQMPKITGFELLELLEAPPVIVFVTAYDDYALKAFEMNAVDYLLKPYSRERFDHTIQKARQAVQNRAPAPKLDLPANQQLNRIVVKSGNSIKIIPTAEIDYLEAQDDYVMICTNREKVLKQQTLKYYEAHLDRQTFVRVHRSYLVRIEMIATLEPFGKSTYHLKLKNDIILPVSRSGYALLKEKLGI